VDLTGEGQDLADALRPAFEAITAAVARLTERSGRQTVTLGAGPIFAARWLAPRLGGLWRAHPDIDLRVHHSPLPVYQQPAQYDLAVAWGDGDWPSMAVEPLMRIAVTPVHAPGAGFLPEGPLAADDLPALPLLHQRNRTGWRQWLRAAGLEVGGDLPGSTFEDANVLLQAVLDGQGIGLGILPFIEDDIAAGRLVQPWELSVDPGEAYYLIYRDRSLQREPVKLVRDWLKAQLPS
jgi:LysR family glycine cleavage system transcriptional activator